MTEQMTTELLAERDARPYFGTVGKTKYAIKVNGVDPSFLSMPFGQQADSLKKLRSFSSSAKKATVTVDSYGGGKNLKLAHVKKWVAENKPSEFYARWDDGASAQIFYKGGSVSEDGPEKMTEQLLEEVARGMQATRGAHLVPTITEPNDGMGLFEASQGRMDKVRGAQSLARLLKKAGTSAKDAKDRIQKKYELSPAELKSVLGSTWGLSAKNEDDNRVTG